MRSYGLNRSLGGAILAIAVVGLLSSTLVYSALSNLVSAQKSRDHASEIVRELNKFRFDMLNQETGLRGYLITANAVSLDPYYAGKMALDDTILRLRDLLINSPSSLQLLTDAEKAARAWQMDISEPAIKSLADFAPD